jgi:death-on-curing protein
LRDEPRWLTVEEIIEVARETVAATGEPFFLRDKGLLEGACNRPFYHWHYNGEDDVVTLAVVLLLGIAQSHPFVQGNKRTAWTAAAMFLELNGYTLDLPDSEILGQVLVDLIQGRISQDEFVAAIQPFVKPGTLGFF